MQFKKLIWVIVAAASVYLGVTTWSDWETPTPVYHEGDQQSYDVRLDFPSDRFPETASHISNAIKQGHSAICTIDRKGAEENRKRSLQGVPTKKGYDRDEWPMAMCAEGGDGADIEYISPSDNRGAGSWVGNKLESYENGTRVYFDVVAD
ncbi:NucA/NucB deoxyribonuclease domain-containing protein [Paenibacillus sp. SYP-B4298]|uniref:NucA/NucB deoxyribonuclease domain-containing protein n=1 Tax=Paenibacillus sp. SYP-B4298 TaxID=2996034 RepID=UPI0022DDFA80|nr:NucA/NucB deoxyribonuclease domain-containing protein [Paenibacillus sp. SYP-B4298]